MSNLDESRATMRSFYQYLNQGEVWSPKDRPILPIADMDPAWRRNAARWLEKRARVFEFYYSLGQLEIAAAAPTALSELAVDDMLSDLDRREDDPVAWIRTTPLYRALLAGLEAEAVTA